MRRANAGHDFKGNVGRRKGFQLFGQPGEDRRITPFEPNDDAPLSRERYEKLVDLGLGHDPVAAVVTETNQLRAQLGMGEDSRVDEVVV